MKRRDKRNRVWVVEFAQVGTACWRPCESVGYFSGYSEARGYASRSNKASANFTYRVRAYVPEER